MKNWYVICDESLGDPIPGRDFWAINAAIICDEDAYEELLESWVHRDLKWGGRTRALVRGNKANRIKRSLASVFERVSEGKARLFFSFVRSNEFTNESFQVEYPIALGQRLILFKLIQQLTMIDPEFNLHFISDGGSALEGSPIHNYNIQPVLQKSLQDEIELKSPNNSISFEFMRPKNNKALRLVDAMAGFIGWFLGGPMQKNYIPKPDLNGQILNPRALSIRNDIASFLLKILKEKNSIDLDPENPESFIKDNSTMDTLSEIKDLNDLPPIQTIEVRPNMQHKPKIIK